jgi:hypothetical protein
MSNELINNCKYNIGDLVWVIVDDHIMRYDIKGFVVRNGYIKAVFVWNREYLLKDLYDTREEALEQLNKSR